MQIYANDLAAQTQTIHYADWTRIGDLDCKAILKTAHFNGGTHRRKSISHRRLGVSSLNALPFLVESRDAVTIHDAPHALNLTDGANFFVASLHQHLKMLDALRWIHLFKISIMRQ